MAKGQIVFFYYKDNIQKKIPESLSRGARALKKPEKFRVRELYRVGRDVISDWPPRKLSIYPQSGQTKWRLLHAS